MRNVIGGMVMLILSVLQPGAEIPKFALRDVSGRIIFRSDVCGKNRSGVVIIDFFATWCKPCIRALEAFERLKKDFSEEELKIFLIAYHQRPEEIFEFFKKRNGGIPPFSLLFDPYGEVAGRFGVRALPRTFVIDASSCKVKNVIYGEQKNLYSLLRKRVKALLKEKK